MLKYSPGQWFSTVLDPMPYLVIHAKQDTGSPTHSLQGLSALCVLRVFKEEGTCPAQPGTWEGLLWVLDIRAAVHLCISTTLCSASYVVSPGPGAEDRHVLLELPFWVSPSPMSTRSLGEMVICIFPGPTWDIPSAFWASVRDTFWCSPWLSL